MNHQLRIRNGAICTVFTLATFTLTLALSFAVAQDSSNRGQPAPKAGEAVAPAAITGSGNANYIAKWTSTTTLGDSGLYQTAGKVGLGTTAPSASLDVETTNTAGTPAIKGDSKATSGTAYGIFGIVNSAPTATGTLAAGIAGTSNGASGNTAGVLGTDFNPSGVGVFGQALATTSSGQRGVQGTAYGPGGVGVRGDATGNTANSSAGVVAVANGPIDTGLSAYATSSTGYTYGVLAIDDSATGIAGFFIATSTTGSPSGIVVYDYSATGTAGSFNSVAGGNILIGQNNGANVFRVDGTGKGYFDGGTTTGGADFAESVAVRGDHVRYEPGDLLAIDPTGNRRLERSQDAYSTRVAGIYSTKPGILATTHAMDDSRLAGEVPLAVMGIVPCKVTAENGAIGVDDLLVTSSHVGYAMKGTDRGRMLGAVVGKAMEPLADGSGVIQVLVTLQ